MSTTAKIDDFGGHELAALEAAADLTGLRVLEVGCGEGRLLFRYAPRCARVLGIDTDAADIEKGRASVPHELASRVRFVVAGAAELAEPDGSFDAALLPWSL